MSEELLAVIPSIGAVGVDSLEANYRTLSDGGFRTQIVSNALSLTAELTRRGLPFKSNESNSGFGASIQVGIIGEQWSWLLVLNDDVSLPQESVAELSTFLNTHTGRDSSSVVYIGNPDFRKIPRKSDVFLNISLLGKAFNIQKRRAQKARVTERYASFNSVAISRSAWLESGGLDPNLIFTFEDADFIQRCFEIEGFEIHLLQSAEVSKLHSISSIAHVDRVLAVSVWSAREFLRKGPNTDGSISFILHAALIIRAITGILSSAGPRRNFSAVRYAIRALRASNPPRLPLYESL